MITKEIRPKIDIKLQPKDKYMEYLGLLLIFSVWVLFLYFWFSLPDIVPMHFDFKGNIDRWGNKNELILLPIITSVLYIGMTIINKFPHKFNFPSEITAENVEKQYILATRFIRSLKITIALMFNLILIHIANSINGNTKMEFLLFPALIIGIFSQLIIYLIKANKK